MENVTTNLTPSVKQLLENLPPETTQAIVVVAACNAPIASVFAVQRGNQGWTQVLGYYKAAIGRNGLAEPGRKREGDGKTPMGIFPLESAFGYAQTIKTKLTYRRITKEDIWVDDPHSVDYNTWTRRGETEARSFEEMRRKDGLYRCGIIVGYNRDPVVAGRGSAIFFHVSRRMDIPTSGCIAMAGPDLARILAWCDPSLKPVAIMTSKKRPCAIKKDGDK